MLCSFMADLSKNSCVSSGIASVESIACDSTLKFGDSNCDSGIGHALI